MQIEIEELNDYAAKRRQTISKIDSALDEIGIGNDVQRRLNDSFKVIAEFCAKLQERACGQAVYDALVNVPVGILHVSDPIGQHALKSALVGAIGQFVHWDINGALEIAADIAEDVNAHPEAARIREMARLASHGFDGKPKGGPNDRPS